jgi:hypothetical protein
MGKLQGSKNLRTKVSKVAADCSGLELRFFGPLNFLASSNQAAATPRAAKSAG